MNQFARFELEPRPLPRPRPRPRSVPRTGAVKMPRRYSRGTVQRREHNRYLRRSTPLHRAAATGHEDEVRKLLKSGADVNARDGLGRTALHQAVESRQEIVAKLLLESGVDVDAKDHSLSTVLHLAVMDRQEMMVRQLLEKGTNIIVHKLITQN